MLNDQASGLANKVIAGTPRDSLHVIDVLYGQDGGVPPEVLVTDTASYSDTVFGILTLGGRIYAPQLADIPDQRLWRIRRQADYGPFNTAARGQIDLEKVKEREPRSITFTSSKATAVRFVSYTERYVDSTGLFRDALIGLLAALANQERIRLSDRVKAGMARARAAGKHIGRPRSDRQIRRRVLELREREPKMSIRAIARAANVPYSTTRRLLR